MAEVRPIPSAVGAFEAQIFDMGKTYRSIMNQAAIRKKMQAEAKKEADKALSEMSVSMSKARSQEIPFLKEKYNKIQQYFSQNAGSLEPGTSEYEQFNKLKADFFYEANRSINEKESDKQIASWISVNSDKEKIAPKTLEFWNMKQKSIYDRGDYKFTRADGSQVDVEQVGLPDLEKYDKYDENVTRKDIESIKGQEVSNLDFIKNYKGVNVPFGTMKETILEFKLPSKILQTFDSRYTSSKDATDFYDNAWKNLSQREKDDMNASFAKLPSIYKAAGIKEEVKLEEKDGVPGISNGYEFGAAKFLLQNLPEKVKEDLDLSLANLYQTQAYRNKMFSLRRTLKVKENIDTGLAKSLLDKGFNLSSYANAFNRFLGSSGAATGTAYRPVDIKKVFPGTNIMRVETRYPVMSGSNLVKDWATAKSITGLGGWKKGAKEWLIKDKYNNYIRVKSQIYDLDPNKTGYETQILNFHNSTEEALRISGNEESYRGFKSLRTTGAEMTNIGGEVEDVFINP